MPLHRLIHPPRIALAPAVLAAGLAWAVAIAALATAGPLALRLFSPLPSPVQPPAAVDKVDVRTLAAALAQQPLFANQTFGSTAPHDDNDAIADIALIGVATGFAGGDAFALFERDGQSVAHRIGDTVAGNWQLLRILHDRVEVGVGPRRMALNLQTNGRHAATPRPATSETPQED